MEGTIPETQINRHKHIHCSICGKSMRSDHMKRHTRTHEDISFLPEEEALQKLRIRHEVQIQQEEKRQKLEEIALQEGIPIALCVDTTTPSILDLRNLEEQLLRDNQIYLDKIELGTQIAIIIGKGTVREESLANHHKEALELYRKQKPRIDIQSIQLRPWQHELLLEVTPSQRHVIWIWGSRGNEGNHGFKAILKTFMAIQGSFI